MPIGPEDSGATPASQRPEPRLSPAMPGDATALSDMAWDIWHRHYHPEILSLPEIRHLWNRAYRPDFIAADMGRGTAYRWIERAQSRVGFVAWRSDTVQNRLWLSKLYVIPECHGRGLGAYALERAEYAARELSLGEIRLYVFKKNLRAIHAYQRAGFRITHEEVSDAGDGFVYDDYVMTKVVTAAPIPDVPHPPHIL